MRRSTFRKISRRRAMSCAICGGELGGGKVNGIVTARGGFPPTEYSQPMCCAILNTFNVAMH